MRRRKIQSFCDLSVLRSFSLAIVLMAAISSGPITSAMRIASNKGAFTVFSPQFQQTIVPKSHDPKMKPPIMIGKVRFAANDDEPLKINSILNNNKILRRTLNTEKSTERTKSSALALRRSLAKKLHKQSSRLPRMAPMPMFPVRARLSSYRQRRREFNSDSGTMGLFNRRIMRSGMKDPVLVKPVLKRLQKQAIQHPKSRGTNLDRNADESIQNFLKRNLDQYEKYSDEWNREMKRFLLDLQKEGHDLTELSTQSPYQEYFNADGNPHTLDMMTGAKIERAAPAVASIIGSAGGGVPMADEATSNEKQIKCKMEPYNICYSVDDEGKPKVIGDRKPIRLIRIYRKKRNII